MMISMTSWLKPILGSSHNDIAHGEGFTKSDKERAGFDVPFKMGQIDGKNRMLRM